MKNFLWIVPDSWLPLLNAHGGVAACYSIPISLSPDAEQLAGATLYILQRSKTHDSVFARVEISSVDIAVDETNAPIEILLNVCLEKSLRVLRDGNDIDARDFWVNSFEGKPIGFSTLDSDSARRLESIIRKGFKILFTHVPESILNKIDPPVTRCGYAIAPMLVLRDIISRFALTEMWGSAKMPHPATNFTYHFLKSHPDFISSGSFDQSATVLRGYDWLTATPLNTSDLTNQSSSLQTIDIALAPIDPKIIKARHFAARGATRTQDSIMVKTEAAEHRHQEMLRDIAQHLLDIGITPYQSTSIDLAINQGGNTSIFELKSFSGTNLVSQSSKGVFQLLYYARVLQDCAAPVGDRFLVIEAGANMADLELVGRIANDAGVRVLVYNSSANWPKRLFEIPDDSGDGNMGFELKK